jgi:putative heme iron utilization protein
MAGEIYRDAARLVLEERWAAVATLDDGLPLATMVAYAPEPGLGGLLMLLSGLAAHTRALLGDPRCSLAVTRPDRGEGDPQLLPRVSIQGAVEALEPESPEHAAGKGLYLARFPDAEPRFDLADFVLFRFVPAEARYVGGFARAIRMTGDQLAGAVAPVS